MIRDSLRQFRLLRRAPAFRNLFLSRLGSGFGTYLAAVALQLDIYERTHSGAWIAGLLVAEFLPVIAIGLLLGPLLDRWPRRTMLVVSDLVNVAVFAALPFASSANQIVGLALVSGAASGFFRPLVYAALPNLVEERELEPANALLQTIENLAMLLGPLAGGVIVAASSPATTYWINAATFLGSAVFVLGIRARTLQTERAASQGHWRDLVAGFGAVRHSAGLRVVLLTWPVFTLATAGVNVAEVVLVKDTFGGGDGAFGGFVAVMGLGLVVGGFASGAVIGRFGLAKAYAGSIAIMGGAIVAAALAPLLMVSACFAFVAGIGNGTAVAANFLIIVRGVPDRLRGRAVTVLMSVGSTSLLLGMVAVGALIDSAGARWVWGGSGVTMLVAAMIGARLARSAVGELEQAGAEPELGLLLRHETASGQSVTSGGRR